MTFINHEQTRKIGELLKTNEPKPSLNFYSYTLPDGTEVIEDTKQPPLNHPATIDFLFAVIMQDYGFWLGSDNIASSTGEHAANGYITPLWAMAGGKRLKGSDFLWTVSMGVLKVWEDFFCPQNLAIADNDTIEWWLADDAGRVPFPDFSQRASLARDYGRDMMRNHLSARNIVGEANKSAQPLKKFLQSISHLPGYQGDPLQKKPLLLAMALANRPEHFLHVPPDDPDWRPIIDYHLMRLALRTGMVDPGNWLPHVEARCVKPEKPGEIKTPYIPLEGEQEIREKVFQAIQEVATISGKSPVQLDFTLWDARRYCPEIEVPNCPACPFTGECQKRTNLFQPVRRTTWY